MPKRLTAQPQANNGPMIPRVPSHRSLEVLKLKSQLKPLSQQLNSNCYRTTTNRESAILCEADLSTLPPVKLAFATAQANWGCNELVFCGVPSALLYYFAKYMR